jgi:hypothetical protein
VDRKILGTALFESHLQPERLSHALGPFVVLVSPQIYLKITLHISSLVSALPVHLSSFLAGLGSLRSLPHPNDADASPHFRGQPVLRSMSQPGLSHEQDIPSSRPGALNGNHLPPPKQIRFISYDGQTYVKRRRMNGACQTCRKRKIRCSGERPEYSTCIENGHSYGGYGNSVQVRKTLPDNTNDEKVVGEDTVNLKLSSGNVDRYVPALQVSSAGGNSSPGDASHRGDWGNPSTSYTTNSIVSTRNRVPYT